MWVTFFLSIVIGVCWFSKMILQKRVFIQRTPLDIPILLFLLSQVIATFHSLDTHMSIWGYYSRFNGGLLSIIAYIFLYYAFVSNLLSQKNEQEKKKTKRPGKALAFFISGCVVFFGGVFLTASISPNDTSMQDVRSWLLIIAAISSFFLFIPAFPNSVLARTLFISLTSLFLVALWGLPSHFGYDPTCLLFRGNFDVSCWTEAFQPKIRMFSTLGQPDWLGAYIAILLPVVTALFLKRFLKNSHLSTLTSQLSIPVGLLLFSLLLYLDLTFTDSRSAFLAFVLANIVFFALVGVLRVFSIKRFFVLLFITNIGFLLISFFVFQPFPQLDRFTFEGVKNKLKQENTQPKANQQKIGEITSVSSAQGGGTDSTKIRQIVWAGALDVWRANPIFGTGVETFALAYYKYRPAEHNLVSEWDYLYNKAHNEYLNYLATTGIFGLGTYVLMIATFLFLSLSWVIKHAKEDKAKTLLIVSLLAGYLSILVSNFFGFSVVIVNIYFFLIPAFVFSITKLLSDKQWSISFAKSNQKQETVGLFQNFGICLVTIVGIMLSFLLFRFWQADVLYALGYNLDRVNQYQQAAQKLHDGVAIRGSEPVFKDELSINDAVLAVAYAQNKDATTAAALAGEALTVSNDIVTNHPNNVVFWKTRVRILYTLSQLNPAYLQEALKAIQVASTLAPTDAKISYNLGVLYGQTGDSKKAVETLENTIKLKADYRDAYFALSLFYHELATDKNGKIIHPEYQQKAVQTLHYTLEHIAPNDDQAKKTLLSWQEKI